RSDAPVRRRPRRSLGRAGHPAGRAARIHVRRRRRALGGGSHGGPVRGRRLWPAERGAGRAAGGGGVMTLLLALLLLPQQNDGRLAGHVPAAALPGVHAIISRAAQDSLPTEPLIEKALEGGAKGVPAEMIVTAVGAE